MFLNSFRIVIKNVFNTLSLLKILKSLQIDKKCWYFGVTIYNIIVKIKDSLF